MKASTSGLDTLLSTSQKFNIADLYTFTLRTGDVFRWTSYDAYLTVGGHAFTSPNGLAITRGKVHQERGTVISTLDVTLDVSDDGSAPLIRGSAIPLAAANGYFRGAGFTLDRLYMPTPGDVSLAPLRWYTGGVDQVRATPDGARLTIRPPTKRLSILQLPRRVYQPPCPYAVYDPGCGLDRSAFSISVMPVAGHGPGDQTITVTGDTATVDDKWALGTLKTSTGVVFGIASSTPGSVTLNLPIAKGYVIEAGLAVTLSLGCKKTLDDCTFTFANEDRFGGTPLVPKPESVR